MRSLTATALQSIGLIALVTLTAPAWGGEEHSGAPLPPKTSTEMLPFYAGSLVRIGNFPGKLVCLRCELKPGPDAMKQCEKEGHRHALLMDSMVHPLLAGTEAVQKQINSADLHAKEVMVHGKYSPLTGILFVDRIEERK